MPTPLFNMAVLLVVAFSFATPEATAQDTIEFLNGSTLTGKMLKIRKSDREFDFETQIGGQSIKRAYKYSKVHAVTFNGRRFELTPMTESSSDSSAKTRSKQEVLDHIQKIGSQPPDWLADTKLNHPQSLDLGWPLKAEGKWNESKNVGQYIWGRVNPNVSRWKPGVKLIYECIDQHAGNRSLLQRDYKKLGEMYFVLFQDYPRAAYWLQKGNASVDQEAGIFLAECFWRLGNKKMATDKLRSNRLHFNAIKLFGDMGEIPSAMRITSLYAKTSMFNEAFLKAGDALRGAGELEKATEYYQKVLDRNQARNAEYLKRYKGLAQGAIEAINLFDRADVSRVSDGTYTASSMGYNGQLEVQAVVKNAKIVDLKVTKHREKQFYAALTDTPKQIIDKQGFQDVDGTSGATITSQAIVNSTARALAKGAN